MKAVILAAGKGSRIHQITEGRPKSLLPFGSTTLLGHSLGLFRDAGVDSVVVVTGYERETIIEHTKEHWQKPVEFVFNPFYDDTNVLFSFWLALPWAGKDDILFLHADTVFSEEVLARVLAEEESDVVFAVDRHPCEEEEMKVQLEDGRVVLVNKEMTPERADGEFLGLAKIRNDTLGMIRRQAEKLFQEKKFHAFFELAIQRCIDEDGLEVKSCDVSGLPWREVDFEEDYNAAVEMFFGNSGLKPGV